MVFTHNFFWDIGFLATNAMSHHQGGVALVYKESPYWQVQSSVLHGPNVISAVIVSGNSRFGIVGAYIPPADTTTSMHVTTALARFPRRKVILVGDLNLDLGSIETERDMEIADILATSRLLDMHRHFKSPGRFIKPATWHQKRKGEVIKSRPDYFLCSDQRIIRQYGIRDPRHFATDHKLVLGTLISNSLREYKTYLLGRTKFPHWIPKMGPLSRLDSLCDDIEEAALPPVSTPEQRRKGWISD